MSGSGCGVSPAPDPFVELVRLAVDGVEVGPVSRLQPAVLQPVAAVPVKVGEKVPRLDDVTLV